MNQLTHTLDTVAAATQCPRCQQPLVDPEGLGWCKGCGYCKSLAEGEKTNAKAPPLPQEKPAQPNAVVATGGAILQTPRWFWVSLIGAIIVAGGTFACAYHFKFTPLQRALLTTVQMTAGFVLMFVGQFIGVLRIAPEESTLGFWDAVIPFRLYGLIMKRLPSSSLTLYLGVWGLTAIITVNVFVGGLPHWLTYLPDSTKQKIPKAPSYKE